MVIGCSTTGDELITVIGCSTTGDELIMVIGCSTTGDEEEETRSEGHVLGVVEEVNVCVCVWGGGGG